MKNLANVAPLGALFEENDVVFRIWAPDHDRAEVVLYDADAVTERVRLPMQAEPGGFFRARVGASGPEASVLYKFGVGGTGPFPDPYSRSQPFGVHGPSEARRFSFAWTDQAFGGVSPEDLVLQEIHVGTATAEGTFEALIPRLSELRSLGITAIELMPLASFPGRWNWGYDGVCFYAPQVSYGGPLGLMRLIDAAHAHGLAVIIDAVYNHLGPDGNYLRAYTRRYFTDRHQTPWGEGLNVDGADARPVRELVARSAEMWIRDYHADGLRLDATHEIRDDSDPHILREIAERARRAGGGKRIVVIAEDERNDERLVRPVDKGGLGLDAVWADDFHHQMRRAFAGDKDGYFQDFSGSAADIARTLNEGWSYHGQTSPRTGKPRGTSPRSLESTRFVHCIQNHDQIGNRAFGDRLGESVSPAAFRAMSALLLLSPYVPLLFMGQEWNAKTRFQYFTDHNAELGRLVTEGRRKEFAAFASFQGAEIPDPQAESTFLASKLSYEERDTAEHAGVRELYRELLHLRAEHPALRARERGTFEARAVGEDALVLTRRGGGKEVSVWVNVRGKLREKLPEGLSAQLILATEEARFGGAGGEAVREGLAVGEVRLDGPAAAVLGSRSSA
ncbi:malto-oligosyltrehalose trehalohydrolase [Polyangium jinanense]|uniref:Malto-oligosyltrehalose trehalohydrolase n=1 Tax=Polyangium jinanense TaxID=2829994 RepID=A0A9X4AXQ7_9BACT|nr:malto-oligosyltrehalose trehalohydrolase [Polyangium jinanense]MDC3961632.1 malto-oligosyltrehalose trehalohydrolase [Polyangium jinanense]MDC3988146.1 malto-oligosyltrehalose trehalohydrolase [Polyangium jinanense]